MKKQFLLVLMAMLLPLAALADSFVVKTTTLRYNGYDQNPVVYSTDGRTQLTEGTDYTVEYTYKVSEEVTEEADAVHDAGTYTMTITAKEDGSYSTYDETEVTLTVLKVELLVQPSEMHKSYGTPDSEVEINYYGSGYVGNDYKGNVEIEGLTLVRKESGETVGEYTVALGISEATATNYTIQTNTTAQLIIDPAILTIEFDNLTWAYGKTEDEIENVTVTGTGYAEGEDDDTVGLTWDFATNAGVTKENVRDAGKYPIIASITSKNYTLDNETKTSEIEITPVELTVVAKGCKKTYGEKDPALETESITGLVEKYGDTAESIGLKLTRAEGEDVGDYEITGCTVTSKNYTVESYEVAEDAKLTINPKSLDAEDIVIEVANKEYQGQAENFKLENDNITVTYKDKAVENTPNSDLTQGTDYTFTITEAKNAGDKVTVNVAAAQTDGTTCNYTGSKTYEFEIAQAPLTLTANPQTVSFDTSKTILELISKTESDVTISAGELKAGDSFDDLGIEFSLNPEVTVKIGENEKCIVINATSEIADNYDITYGDWATLTVNTGAARDNSIIIGRDTENTSSILEAYNGYQAVSEPDNWGTMIGGGFTVNVRDSRTLNDDYWYSMVLPFDISVRDFSKATGYAVVNVPNKDNSDPNVVSFKLTVGQIPANTLFLFKADNKIDMSKGLSFKLQGTTGTFIGDGHVVIDYDPEYFAEDNAGNRYYGVYEKTYIQEDGDFYLSGGRFSNAGKYYEEKGTPVTVHILSGYVHAVGGANARILVEEPDGSTTVINAVNADAAANAEGWYTIGGVKLNAEPTQKGIYINNGKKVVIK